MTSVVQMKSSKPTAAMSLLGAVVGGMVFGMLMQMMKMMQSVAMLVHSNSVAVGWMVHIGISMIFGLVYYAISQVINLKLPRSLSGLIYGIGLWVVGALWLMPSKLHMPTFHFGSMAWKSLMGHMIFGLLLASIASMRVPVRNQ